MLANARNPHSPTVHHGILAAPGSECMWRGTLCNSRHRFGGSGAYNLEETSAAVTCMRCLAVARKREA